MRGFRCGRADDRRTRPRLIAARWGKNSRAGLPGRKQHARTPRPDWRPRPGSSRGRRTRLRAFSASSWLARASSLRAPAHSPCRTGFACDARYAHNRRSKAHDLRQKSCADTPPLALIDRRHAEQTQPSQRRCTGATGRGGSAWKARSQACSQTITAREARPRIAPTTPTPWFNACRTPRGGSTSRPSRCAWGARRATGTCPEAVQSACIVW